MAGGPAQHGGNRYHYLYAARYLVDLLNPNFDVSSVWLEGYPGASDDDILDVAIETGTTLRVVQVKWSQDGTMYSSEAYKIFSRLWSNKSIADRTVGSASLIIATNRNIAPELKAELEVASQWGGLDSVDLASILSDPDIGQTESRLKLGLINVTNGSDDPATLLEAAKLIHVEYLNSIESVAELVTAKLGAFGLPPSRITDITDLAQRYCIGELATSRITADIVAKELGLTSRFRLRHDISRTPHYVEWPDLGQHLDSLVSQLTLSGGTIVVLGSPGVGKSTQLHEWSTSRNAAFYACRIDQHISDIPLRARIETFFSELPRLIRRSYPDRVAASPNYSVESSVPELVGSLNNLLDALGSSSPGTPGLIVIDGIDDVVRSSQNGAENFLSFLPEPPPGVVYVISSQGPEFLPMWAAKTANNVEYVEFPSAPVELLMQVAEKVLSEALAENQSSFEPSELEPISARTAAASSGNHLLLRTLCGELLSRDPSEWAAHAKNFDTYSDIFDYYDRNLNGVSPAARKLLKYLALARIPLTYELIVDVILEGSEVVRDALRETDHLLIKSSYRVIKTYTPYHPALRSYSDLNFLVGENRDIHSQFANAYRDYSEDPHYASQQAHHLFNSDRQSEIVALVTYEFVDRLFESVANPVLIREQVNLFATALPDDCEPKLAVFANLLASKIDARVQHLQSLSTFNSDDEIERFVDLLEVIVRTRPLTDGINSAIDQLDAVDDPEGRFQIAIRLALRLFRSNMADGASSIFAVAKNTAFIHDAGKDIKSLANNFACQIWNGDPVDQVLTRAMSTKWSRTGRDEVEKELPEHEQHRLNAQVVEIIAEETMQAGRAEELRGAIAHAPAVHRPAALLGAMRVGDRDWDLVKELTATFFSEAHVSSDQNLQIATIICRHKGLPDLAEKLQNPSNDFHVPDLIGGTLPEEKPKIKSFLVELEFRLRLGADTTPQFQIFGDSSSDRDRKKGCELYFTAAKSSFEFRIASEDGAPIERLNELGNICLAIWETPRPQGMWFTPYLDAKQQIRELTPGLLISAFTANPDLGNRIGDQILSLPSGAVGALHPDALLQTLMHLGNIPEARPWVVRTLNKCVDQSGEIRSTQERIDLFIKAANIFLQADLLVDAERLLVEALKCTKGIPYGDEEPRYYAAQILIDKLREFGINVTDHVYKMGQLIEDSFDVTGRTYAGNTWPWLVESFARIDLARSLNLALALDGEQDSDALEIQESLLNVCVGSIEFLDPVSWASLAWIADWKNGSHDTRKNYALSTVLDRCDSDEQRANFSRWLTPVDEGFDRRSESAASEFREDTTRTPEFFNSENANAAVSGDSTAAELVLDELEQLITSDESVADDFLYRMGLMNWLLSVSKVTDKNLLQRIMEVSERFGALGSYRAELLVAIAERIKDEEERATKLLLTALEESIWYEGSQAIEALKLLHQIDPALARQELVKRIHSRRGTSSPYFLAIVLAALPIELYGEHDIEETLSAIFDDISDSLGFLPKRNLRHSIDREIAPRIKSVPEMVRELLHSTRSDIRALALEGVGILGHNQSLNLPVLFADTKDLSGFPRYLVLTAIQQRLAALWVLAELDPASVAAILPRIMQSYISEQPNHFLTFEYTRRLSEQVLNSMPINLSTRIASAIQSRWRRITKKSSLGNFSLVEIRKLKGPRHIKSWPARFEPGRSPVFPAGILDRGFEFEIERLGAIFRTPATQVENLIRRFSPKIYQQTEEELANDRRTEERNYGSDSKPIVSVREDIVKHAYRFVQQRWFTRRIADEKEIQQWGASGIEHRLFDPWLPRLFFGSSRLLLDSPPDKIGLEEDQRGWLFDPPADVQKYLEESEGIIVDQYHQSESEHFRLTYMVDSCLISDSMIDEWLAGGAKDPIHHDLPYGIYIKELTDDFSSWWSQYSYGEYEDSEGKMDSLYAEGFSERPYDSLRLTVPMGISGSHPQITRNDDGYSIYVSRNVIWNHRSFSPQHYKSIISRKFLYKRLKREKTSLGLRVLVIKARIKPGESRWELAEEVAWTIPAVMDRRGVWNFGEAKMEHLEFNEP